MYYIVIWCVGGMELAVPICMLCTIYQLAKDSRQDVVVSHAHAQLNLCILLR